MAMPTRAVALAVAFVAVATTVARADTPKRIEVAPWCSRTADRLGFHLAFVAGIRRTVVNLTCDLNSGNCAGATLELGALDGGAPLGALALGAVTGARVESTGPDMSLIRWGSRPFVFDHRGGFVTFGGMRATCE